MTSAAGRRICATKISQTGSASPGETGVRRSVQVFDAAGDAVHKVHLRDGSDLDGWATLKAELEIGTRFAVEPRAPVEAAKGDADGPRCCGSSVGG